MEVPLIAAAVFVVVVLILAGQRLLRPRRPPYRKVDSLLTAAERSFYGVLLKAVDGETLVFALFLNHRALEGKQAAALVDELCAALAELPPTKAKTEKRK